MPRRSRVYINMLTDEDRVIVRKITDGKAVVEFAVQYEVLIEGEWHKVARYDNSHGQPHRHAYYPNGNEYRENLTINDSNKALNEAERIIKHNFNKMRVRYIILLTRKDRRWL